MNLVFDHAPVRLERPIKRARPAKRPSQWILISVNAGRKTWVGYCGWRTEVVAKLPGVSPKLHCMSAKEGMSRFRELKIEFRVSKLVESFANLKCMGSL